MSAAAGTGTATSSSSAVVPEGRAPATEVYRPLRMRHSAARSPRVLRSARPVRRPPASRATPGRPLVRRGRLGVRCRVFHQQRGVAVDRERAQRRRRLGPRPGRPVAIRRPSVRSSRGPAATSSGIARHRRAQTREDAAGPCRGRGAAGTVRKVASATKARVPSLPTIRWARMSTGALVVEEGVERRTPWCSSSRTAGDRAHRLRVRRGPGRAAGQPVARAPVRGAAAARRRRARRCRRRCRSAARTPATPVSGRCWLRAAGHAAGVVGDDAADGAGDLAGRVRAELAAVGRRGAR